MYPIAYVGIDVQSSKKCSCAILDSDLKPHSSAWLGSVEEITSEISDLRRDFQRVVVGIDAPRCLLEKPREYYWDGRRRSWRARKPQEKGHGRHCEVVISAFGIANPQWTPLVDRCPPWMDLGFSIFSELSAIAETYEVFPSASYKLLENEQDAVLQISLARFFPGPKDMLDAYVAALTVHDFRIGSGKEVGGGDGLGTIVLPRPLSGKEDLKEVLAWPV